MLAIPTAPPSTSTTKNVRVARSASHHAENVSSNPSSSIGPPAFSSFHARRNPTTTATSPSPAIRTETRTGGAVGGLTEPAEWRRLRRGDLVDLPHGPFKCVEPLGHGPGADGCRGPRRRHGDHSGRQRFEVTNLGLDLVHHAPAGRTGHPGCEH